MRRLDRRAELRLVVMDAEEVHAPPPACHSSAAAIRAGMDIEMPRGVHINNATIAAELAAGNLTLAQIDDSCERIMRGWCTTCAAIRSRVISRHFAAPTHLAHGSCATWAPLISSSAARA